MPDGMQLMVEAREIFDEALRAVDVRDAVCRAIQNSGTVLQVGSTRLELRDRKVYAIALGKCKFPIFDLERELAASFEMGFLTGPFPGFDVTGREAVQTKIETRWRWARGGHPLPTENSLLAAEESFKILDRANEEGGVIIFLISGGGSAMIEWPIDDEITLADLRAANKALIGCGASIGEVNAVRRASSAVKGGRLAARAPNCDQITLIVSDVPKGEEHNVASGPTWPPPPDAPAARDVVAHYDLRDRLPPSIVRAIDTDTRFGEPTNDRQKHFVLLDNETALETAANAARARGFITEIARDIADDPIEIGCEKLLARVTTLQSQNPNSNVCLLSGGEFACPVRGDGMGGRNSETALRVALAVDKDRDRYGEFAALCAGTDGIDGNSFAAGAIANSTTVERARGLTLEPSYFLDNSDSATFFERLQDAIETGPTGTNVRDLRILISKGQ
jgi:glycerate 2-kinase